MSSSDLQAASKREPVLNAVDRVSELLFGLFMALKAGRIKALVEKAP